MKSHTPPWTLPSPSLLLVLSQVQDFHELIFEHLLAHSESLDVVYVSQHSQNLLSAPLFDPVVSQVILRQRMLPNHELLQLLHQQRVFYQFVVCYIQTLNFLAYLEALENLDHSLVL